MLLSNGSPMDVGMIFWKSEKNNSLYHWAMKLYCQLLMTFLTVKSPLRFSKCLKLYKKEKSEILRLYYKLHLEKMLPGVIKSLGFADETILFEKKNIKGTYARNQSI